MRWCLICPGWRTSRRICTIGMNSMCLFEPFRDRSWHVASADARCNTATLVPTVLVVIAR